MLKAATLIIALTFYPNGRDAPPDQHVSYSPKASLAVCERDRHNLVLAGKRIEAGWFMICVEDDQ